MEQMKAFIEKARNDKALMAKLDELSAGGAEMDKIIALAAEHGFTITAEDYRQAVKAARMRKSGELNEKDLEAASGGYTQNRYNPSRCKGLTQPISGMCTAFFLEGNCDHLNYERALGSGYTTGKTRIVSCNMGAFPPYSEPV